MSEMPKVEELSVGGDICDEESRKRFYDDYAADLLKIVRQKADGKQSQTPQDAANELIDITVDALSLPGGTLPEPIRDYLHRALSEIQSGKGADVALGIRKPAGNHPLDGQFVTTVIGCFALEIRRGKTPLDAKKKILSQVEKLCVGGRTMDWVNDLLDKHSDKLPVMERMTDEELSAIADFDSLPEEARIK